MPEGEPAVQEVPSGIPGLQITDEALKQVSNEKLPKIWKKAPPAFDKTQPGTLNKYLDEIEEFCAAYDVTLPEAKIVVATKYMEYETRKSLEKFAVEAGKDWEAFKKILKEQFPESVESGTGSVRRLKEIVNNHRIIPINQRERFLKFLREFELEYSKLKEPPAALSNAEAVRLFMKTLDAEFRRALTPLLPEPDEERRVEDPFDLDDIIAAAKQACRSRLAALYSVGGDSSDEEVHRSSSLVAGARKSGVATSSKVKETPRASVVPKSETVSGGDDLFEKLYASMDTNALQLKELATQQALSTNVLSELAKLLVNQGATQQQLSGLTDLSKPRMNRFGNQMTVREYLCFFCGGKDHKMNECPTQTDFIENKKWIIRKDGQLRLRDGSYVPQGDSVETRAQKIEKIAKQKGWDKPQGVMFQSEEENEDAYGDPPVTELSMAAKMTSLLQNIQAKSEAFENRVKAIETSRSEDVEVIRQLLLGVKQESKN
ncbi:hypothetical protein VKT23_014917 [Stygiomarasmius scandens]|uniref:CCHC-type domain-containing protein n=1 Tax=Marasmiellus scandens TaxID=2682957 RepID=A0ABR1IZN5_9AGAR